MASTYQNDSVSVSYRFLYSWNDIVKLRINKVQHNKMQFVSNRTDGYRNVQVMWRGW